MAMTTLRIDGGNTAAVMALATLPMQQCTTKVSSLADNDMSPPPPPPLLQNDDSASTWQDNGDNGTVAPKRQQLDSASQRRGRGSPSPTPFPVPSSTPPGQWLDMPPTTPVMTQGLDDSDNNNNAGDQRVLSPPPLPHPESSAPTTMMTMMAQRVCCVIRLQYSVETSSISCNIVYVVHF
ncbi:hypothetical protein L210DRAFT_3507502 [Boletus edulis BED1]|uniref:Uncharacterized protein n=1 Tax=Boletus edulis BED1 TaxID=1328754 RepID=A0AAD4BJQ0_BOLED|nr:hypothetical protein L210DRAFT_3507502 [Boletus edulis BED1]